MHFYAPRVANVTVRVNVYRLINSNTTQDLSAVLRTRSGKLAAGLVACVAAYLCAGLILQDDLITLYYVGIGFVAGAACIAILNDWRRGLYCFVAWIVVEDLARKYLGNNMAIYFTKDLLAMVLYISFLSSLRAARQRIFRPPFLALLAVFFWYCAMQIFNPAATSIFYGFMGFKLCFYYIPMLVVGYEFVDSQNALRRLLLFICVLVLVVAVLGIVQSILGPTFLNPTVIQEDIRELSTTYRVSPITGLVAYRPTSVFVGTGRFQNFLVLSWIVSLGFGGLLLMRPQSGRTLGFVTLGVVAAASVMCTSRGVLVWAILDAIVMGAALFWGAAWKAGQKARALRAIFRTLIVGAVAFTGMITIFPDQVASRLAIYSETLSLNSPKSELVYRARDYPLENFALAFDYPRWPYGYGLGTASLGGQYVTRIMHAKPMNIGVENGYGQILLELGIVGLGLWIFLVFMIIKSAWRVIKALKGTTLFPIGFGIFWFAFVLLVPMTFYGFTAYEDFILNAYLWLLLGVLFRLPEIVKRTRLTQ